jgi:hypothetical protein
MDRKLFTLQFRISSTDLKAYCKVLQSRIAWKTAIHADSYDLAKSQPGSITTLINTMRTSNGINTYLKILPEDLDISGISPIRIGTITSSDIVNYIVSNRNVTIDITAYAVTVSFYDELDTVQSHPSGGVLIDTIWRLIPSELSNNNPVPSKKGVKIYRCPNCGGASEDKNYLKKYTNSLGKKSEMCSYCNKTVKCSCCGFDEPTRFVRRAIDISAEDGANIRLQICTKCSQQKFPEGCQNCGYYYNHKEFHQCPCQIREDFKSMIQPFNADVLKFYKMDTYSDELFGIEIESGTLARNRRFFPEIADVTGELIAGDAIMKYDSSIDYINKAEGVKNLFRGFEVVTRPMLYKNTIRFMRKFCKNRHPTLRSWEVGTCGLHIHVSKKCLRPIEVGKILLFINSKVNRNFIKMIAKREDKKYAKFLPKKITDFNKNTPGANGVPNEHYEAINTSKPHTIEFRMFRGTLNAQTMVSYLQFVKSLVEFVRVTENINLTYKKYVDWLFSTERSSFRELKERIKSEQVTRIKEDGEI